MRDVIPDRVFAAIQTHLRERTMRAERGWEAGEDDEDTLTGDFGGSLRTDGWVEARQNRPWRWRVTYKKFRGRGPDALERITGADGIFQVEVYPGNELIVSKGIIFQAKKYRGSSRGDLIDQVGDMERIAPGGAAVFEFGPNGYRGSSGRDILEQRERSPLRIPHPQEPLSIFLSDRFLPCDSGLRGMYYDAVREILIVPHEAEGVREERIRLNHRIAIEAKSIRR